MGIALSLGRLELRNPNLVISINQPPSGTQSLKQMYTSDVADDAERTAFRKAEKTYKLYYDQKAKSSKKKKLPKPVNLTEVLDFQSILDCHNRNEELPIGVSVLKGNYERPIFCLDSRPGFYFIPGALSIGEQSHWIRESLLSFPQPPNRTNHNAIYGPIHNLFIAAKERKSLVEEKNLEAEENILVNGNNTKRWSFSMEHGSSSTGQTCKSVPASALVRKLRWSTLGLQFDWSKKKKSKTVGQFPKIGDISLGKKRSYNVSLPHNKIPEALCQLAKKLASPAMLSGEEFQPEAAIVNYFGSGDMLGGHLDDMEADWSKPIVSMSLGCKAIFLLGGKSRDDQPIAMFLRSGDIVLMAGEARECFHGVPRIFADKENVEISPLELQFSHEDDHCFLEYIRTSRININIRQVY